MRSTTIPKDEKVRARRRETLKDFLAKGGQVERIKPQDYDITQSIMLLSHRRAIEE